MKPRLRDLTPAEWKKVMTPRCRIATAAGAFFLAIAMLTPAKATPDTARAYLVETATPGFTMMLQGPDTAIGRLHPEFAQRLADAIAEARSTGLPDAGIFSAYRPPAFGIGGFSDKFNSLHAYGLAVDMAGIGRPGSDDARKWHEIAAKHSIVCPYGYAHPVEWNHCQSTRVIAARQTKLPSTITRDGPADLERMWAAGALLLVPDGDHPRIVASSFSQGKKKKHKKHKHRKKRNKRR